MGATRVDACTLCSGSDDDGAVLRVGTMPGFITSEQFQKALVGLVLKELRFKNITEAHPLYPEFARIIVAQANEVKRSRGDMNVRIIAGRLKLKLETILKTMADEKRLEDRRANRPQREPVQRLPRRRR